MVEMKCYHCLLPCFFEYFDYCQTRDSVATTIRIVRRRHLRINRSIIGQHASLLSESAPALLTTVATEGRERRMGEVAGEVIVSEMSVSEGMTSSTSVGNRSPRRPTAHNDGRELRGRSYNVDFCISPSVSLSPPQVVYEELMRTSWKGDLMILRHRLVI